MSVPLSYRHPSSSSSPPPPPQCLPLPLSLRNGQKECSLSQAFQQSTRLPDALPGRNRLDVGRLDGGRDGRWREWWCWGGGGGDHSGIMRLWLGYLWEHAQVRNQKMQSSRNKCYTQNRDCHLKMRKDLPCRCHGWLSLGLHSRGRKRDGCRWSLSAILSSEHCLSDLSR